MTTTKLRDRRNAELDPGELRRLFHDVNRFHPPSPPSLRELLADRADRLLGGLLSRPQPYERNPTVAP